MSSTDSAGGEFLPKVGAGTVWEDDPADARFVTNLLEPPLDRVFRRRESADGINERRLFRHIERGEVVRIAPGSFVVKPVWAALSDIERHAQRVWEAAARTARGTVFSHHAACSLWSIDVLGAWPELVDVSVNRMTGGRTTGRLRRRTRQMGGLDLRPWGEHFVTSPAQTVIDMASAFPFVDGVIVADRALWSRRAGGSLVSLDELTALARDSGSRGQVRARRVVEFATAESDSVRESQSRVVLDQLGFPAPELQHRFVLHDGRRVRSDFFWEDWDHVGEFDGTGKYTDPAMLSGTTPRQALIREKDREDALRRVVGKVSRWRTPHLERPARLWDILTSAGLPSGKPRPGF